MRMSTQKDRDRRPAERRHEALQQRLEEERCRDGEGTHDHVTVKHVAEESDGQGDGGEGTSRRSSMTQTMMAMGRGSPLRGKALGIKTPM